MKNRTKQSGASHLVLVLAVVVALVGVLGFLGYQAYKKSTASADSVAGVIKGIGGKCLDNNKDLAVNANKIQLWDCDSSNAQLWTVKANGTIVNANGYCLDVSYASKRSGTKVQLYQCNSTVAQQWKVNYTSGTIVNPNSGLCLDVRWGSTANGSQVQVYNCNGSAAQKWLAPPAAGTAPTTTTPTPTPTPTPAPTTTTPSTSGTPGLTNASVLTDYTGPYDISSGTVLIENKRLTKRLTVSGGTVTVRNSTSNFKEYYHILASGGTVIVENSEFDGMNSGNGDIAVSGPNTTIRSSVIKNFENGLRLDGNNLAENNLIHQPTTYAGAHSDGIEIYKGSNITVRGNTIDIKGGSGETGCVNISAGVGWGPIDNVRVENNDFTGGTYSLYVEQKDGAPSVTNVHVVNNRWHGFIYGTHAVINKSVIVEWSGNTYNGAAVNL